MQDQFPKPLPPKPASNNSTWVIIMVLLSVFGGFGLCCCPALLLPAVQSARESARRMQCSNNLKQIGLALHWYHTTHNRLPPPFVADDEGNPLYSWRVLILPFLERQDLFDQFDLEKAWDSPENIGISEQILPVFQCPSSPGEIGPYTDYVVVVGPETPFPGDQPIGFDDVRDGLSNTIMVVEVRNSGIHWAEPIDISMEDALASGINGHESGIGSHHPGGMNVTFGDGAVVFVEEDLAAETLRGLFTRSSGEVVGYP